MRKDNDTSEPQRKNALDQSDEETTICSNSACYYHPGKPMHRYDGKGWHG